MRRDFAISLAIGLVVLAGCSLADGATSGVSPVNTAEDDQVGESMLERETDGIAINFEACCVTPGNAYTAWWVIGDVTKPMSAVKTILADGWVAESEEVKLELELEAGGGGIASTNSGVRLVVLDHGPETGDPKQLSTPGGGCSTTPCPVVLRTSHPAP
jgi:hypothetical protein